MTFYRSTNAACNDPQSVGAPIRDARAQSVLKFIGWHRSESGVDADVPDIIAHFSTGPAPAYNWTRGEVDAALDDLVRSGYIELIPDITSIEVKVLPAAGRAA